MISLAWAKSFAQAGLWSIVYLVAIFSSKSAKTWAALAPVAVFNALASCRTS